MIAGVASQEQSGSIARVLRIMARNRELRRVELAFATFNVAEWGTWLAMLVYAYAHGGVTAAGVLPTAVLAPAAGLRLVARRGRGGGAARSGDVRPGCGRGAAAGGLRGAIPAGKGAHRRV